MNRLFFVIASVLIAGLSACNKELEQVPTPAKARAGGVNGLPPIVTQKRYQLTRRGDNLLTYDFPSNRLSKVTYMNNYGGTVYYEYNDTPGSKLVKTSRYYSSQLLSNDIYRLDNNGLCVWADYWSYTYDPNYSQTEPTYTSVIHRKYEYLDGRISYLTTTAETATRGESLKPFGDPITESFLYNTNGDLTIITAYVNKTKIHEVLFGYGSSVNQPDIEDKLPLNPIEVTPNPYLPIFGSFNKHLVRSELVKYYDGSTPPPGGYKTTYDYVLNKDGYVANRELKRWDKFILSESYEYSPVPTLPF